MFLFVALYESQWKPPQCRQVLEAINQVLYTDLGFSGNSVNYYSPENSYINKVSVDRQSSQAVCNACISYIYKFCMSAGENLRIF